MKTCEKIFWIDVRTPEEFRDWHVEGAINIPFNELSLRLDEIPVSGSDRINVYCKAGVRSAIARSILESCGFENVHDAGGLSDLPSAHE